MFFRKPVPEGVCVCDIDVRMLLTVKGRVDPFPIVLPPSLNEGGGFCYILCVFVHVCEQFGRLTVNSRLMWLILEIKLVLIGSR